MTLVENGFGAPLVTYTITGSVTVTTGLDPDVGGCCDVYFFCVLFADWMALVIGITGVEMEGLLLLVPPRSAADEDWAELGITKESREDVEPGI